MIPIMFDKEDQDKDYLKRERDVYDPNFIYACGLVLVPFLEAQ